jgi:hypothetical protein
MANTIKIEGKEYNLKVTLGFWKKLNIPREDFASILTNAERFSECIVLAVFYGNKNAEGWNTLKEMLEVLKVNDFIDELGAEEEVEEVYGALSEAVHKYLPKPKEGQEKEIDTKKQ